MKKKSKRPKKEVDRFPLLLTSAISNATKLITCNKGGCVVIHSHDGGTPYELIALESVIEFWRNKDMDINQIIITIASVITALGIIFGAVF